MPHRAQDEAAGRWPAAPAADWAAASGGAAGGSGGNLSPQAEEELRRASAASADPEPPEDTTIGYDSDRVRNIGDFLAEKFESIKFIDKLHGTSRQK